jgi:hypothetical protein
MNLQFTRKDEKPRTRTIPIPIPMYIGIGIGRSLLFRAEIAKLAEEERCDLLLFDLCVSAPLR